MDYIQNIVVIDGKGKNPAKLHTQLEPIKLKTDMAMAITSISHGEVHNIHSNNNIIHVCTTFPAGILSVMETDEIRYTKSEMRIVEIPVGRYKSTSLILKAIEAAIKKTFRKTGSSLNISTNIKNARVTITPADIFISVDGKSDSPWDLLGLTEDIEPGTEKEMDNRDLLATDIMPAFLYVNIVENSYINGKLSRNLAMVPISLQNGCSFYEFKHPTFVPIIVKIFSDILLELRNMQGHYVPFTSSCNTVITLELKPINRGV